MFNKYKHKAVLVHKADGAPNSKLHNSKMLQ